MSEARLVMMVKDPACGKVKTRLAASLGSTLAETLYRCFVADLMETLRGAPCNFAVAFSPHGSRKSVEGWLGKEIPLMEQTGSGLGERMRNLFLGLFSEGFSRVAIVGSDVPDLTGDVIEEAFLRLKEEDAVIGPALDGGYYLIGFRKEGFLPDIFEGIAWGTGQVYEETMRIFLSKGRRVDVLPRLSDVDTLEDLTAFFHRHEDTAFRTSHTIACIREHKESIFP